MKNLITLVFAMMMVNTAFSQATRTWQGNALAGDKYAWGNGANWSGGAVPNSSNPVVINSSSYPPDVKAPGQCSTLTFGTNGTLKVTSSLTVSGTSTVNPPINVGSSGTITIESTGLLTALGNIANAGTVTIKGILEARGNINNTGTFGSTRTGTAELLRFNGNATRTFTSSKDVTISNLTFSPANDVYLNFTRLYAHKRLYVTRQVEVKGGDVYSNGWLTLVSDATSTANVYNSSSGVIRGDIRAQRHIDARFNAGAGYRHYSSPVENTTFTDFTTLDTVSTNFSPIVDPGFHYPAKIRIDSYPANMYPNVFAYDERNVPLPANTQSGTDAFEYGYYGPSSTSATLDAGRGYTARIPASSKIDLVGTAHNGPYEVTNPDGSYFTKTTTSRRSGFHLVGNPYPSFIDISAVMSDNVANFVPNVYLYHSTQLVSGQYYAAGAYTVLNLATVNDPNYTGQDSLNRNFSMMQAFFVEKDTTARDTAYFFNNNQRLIYDANFNPVYPPDHISYFYRSATRPADIRTLQLTLTNNRSHLTDNGSVIFRPEATTGPDRLYDARRPGDNGGGFPTLFTRNRPGEQLMLNALPTLKTRTTVAVGMRTLVPGEEYTLRAPKWLNPAAGTRVYLEDREKGRTRELTSASAYTFTATEKTYENRFFLRFESAGGNVPAMDQTTFVAYPNPGVVGHELQFSANGVQGAAATATLLDALGRTVATQQVKVSEGLLDGSLPTATLKPGIYLLRLNTENATRTQRVEIR